MKFYFLCAAAVFLAIPLHAQYQYRTDDNSEIIQRILEDRVPVKKRPAETQAQPVKIQNNVPETPAQPEKVQTQPTTTPSQNTVTTQPTTPVKPQTTRPQTARTTTPKRQTAAAKPKPKAKAGDLPPASTPDKTLLEAGINLYESGNIPAALDKFAQLKSKFPASPYVDQTSTWLARSYLRQGKSADALTELGKIPEDSGEYPASLYLAGQIYRDERQYDKSNESFMKIAARFPGHDLADDALIEAGKIQLLLNNGPIALADATQVVKSYPDRETLDDAYYLIGMILEKDANLRDIEKAKLVFQKFVYRAEVEKVDAFARSPLLDRVKREIDYIERNFLKSR